MPNRAMHNLIAYRITGFSKKMIDQVNAKVDSTVKEKGFGHRVDFHSMNPIRKDSIEVTGLDPKREVARRIHIIMDTTPRINRMAKLTEQYGQLKRRRMKYGNR